MVIFLDDTLLQRNMDLREKLTDASLRTKDKGEGQGRKIDITLLFEDTNGEYDEVVSTLNHSLGHLVTTEYSPSVEVDETEKARRSYQEGDVKPVKTERIIDTSNLLDYKIENTTYAFEGSDASITMRKARNSFTVHLEDKEKNDPNLYSHFKDLVSRLRRD